MSYEEISAENKLLFEAIETCEKLISMLGVLKMHGSYELGVLVDIKSGIKKKLNSNIREMEI